MALLAAREIVDNEGLQGLSTRRVAKKIGYTAATLYNVFENLDDLITQLNVITIDVLYEDLKGMKLPDEPDRALLKLSDGFIAFTREECRFRIRGPFLNRVQCRGTDRKASFRRHPAVPDLFRLVAKAKGMSIPPFSSDLSQVNVVMTVGADNRPDVIGDLLPCSIREGEVSKFRCDEPTGF